MNSRNRVIAFVCITVLVIIGAAGYGLNSYKDHHDALAKAPDVAQADPDKLAAGPRVVFRNTALGDSYGLLAEVSTADPGGPRSIINTECDRVYATTSDAVCLQTERGVLTTFRAVSLDADWGETDHWPLPGIPSRTRLSPDGTLAATTSFVAGHSYMTTGFSTATVVQHLDGGTSYGNLEKFDVYVDDEQITATDLNVWGVTFAHDDNTFYATAAFGSKTWLVKGDLSNRTLTEIHEGAECPSLSPDEKLVAYKKNIGGDSKHWAIAVLDLATGVETQLSESNSVDDQVEWLDDSTLLYGLPRTDEAGVNDIWSIGITKDAQPAVYIPEAWSPSVIR